MPKMVGENPKNNVYLVGVKLKRNRALLRSNSPATGFTGVQ
jgi:hypothetical protein